MINQKETYKKIHSWQKKSIGGKDSRKVKHVQYMKKDKWTKWA